MLTPHNLIPPITAEYWEQADQILARNQFDLILPSRAGLLVWTKESATGFANIRHSTHPASRDHALQS